METMSNWMGFDADLMNKNPAYKEMLRNLTVRGVELWHEEYFLKGKAVFSNPDEAYDALSEEDPITGALLSSGMEE